MNANSLKVGDTVGGRWRIERFIASGGFGQVFAAADVSTAAVGEVAVKVLLRGASTAERRNFLAEVRHMAALDHENLVTHVDSGLLEDDEEGAVFLVTELCDESLDDLCRAQPGGVLPEALLPGLVVQVSAGLDHLHRSGRVHRDLKPANILRSGDVWKLADFGLVRDLSSSGVYHLNTVAGTPRFMAPEFFDGGSIGPAVDIWSMGIVVHETASGHKVFDGEGAAFIHNVTSLAPTISPSLRPELAGLIRRCLTTDPAARPSASDLPKILAAAAQPPNPDWAPPVVGQDRSGGIGVEENRADQIGADEDRADQHRSDEIGTDDNRADEIGADEDRADQHRSDQIGAGGGVDAGALAEPAAPTASIVGGPVVGPGIRSQDEPTPMSAPAPTAQVPGEMAAAAAASAAGGVEATDGGWTKPVAALGQAGGGRTLLVISLLAGLLLVGAVVASLALRDNDAGEATGDSAPADPLAPSAGDGGDESADGEAGDGDGGDEAGDGGGDSGGSGAEDEAGEQAAGDESDTDGGSAADTSRIGQTVAFDEFRVGDCVDAEIVDDRLLPRIVRACDAAHNYEVIGLLEHPDTGGDFPGDPALFDFGSTQCREAFQTRFGVDEVDTALQVVAFRPNEDDWNDEVFNVICMANRSDLEPLTVALGDNVDQWIWSSGDELNFLELQLGRCFDPVGELSLTGLTVQRVIYRDCDELHRGEHFWTILLFDLEETEGTYPSEDLLRSEADRRCHDELHMQFGAAFPLRSIAIVPTEQEWTLFGAKLSACILIHDEPVDATLASLAEG